jgi:hypothetical protein
MLVMGHVSNEMDWEKIMLASFKKRLLAGVVLTVLVLNPCGRAEESQGLSSSEFFDAVRRPFLQDAWGRLSGKVVGRIGDRQAQTPLTLSLRFSPKMQTARVVFAGKDVYTIRQTYLDGKVSLEEPTDPEAVQLSDFGILAEDLVFSFLHWDLDRELDRDRLRGQACRVLLLRHPQNGMLVKGWFSDKYLFPLRIQWFRPGDDSWWRQCQFTDFKKQEDGFWFVQTVRLDGQGWKSKLSFEDVQVYEDSRKAPPEDLF